MALSSITCLIIASLLSAPASADGTSRFDDEDLQLSKEMKLFQPFLGTWEITAEWSDGSPLWARNSYEVSLGGKFVTVKTWTKDDTGKIYQRYLTVYGIDMEKDQLVAHGYAFDGKTTRNEVQASEEDGTVVLNMKWNPDPQRPAEVKQTVTISGDESYSWKVWMRNNVDEDWVQIMDGEWKRASR